MNTSKTNDWDSYFERHPEVTWTGAQRAQHAKEPKIVETTDLWAVAFALADGVRLVGVTAEDGQDVSLALDNGDGRAELALLAYEAGAMMMANKYAAYYRLARRLRSVLQTTIGMPKRVKNT